MCDGQRDGGRAAETEERKIGATERRTKEGGKEREREGGRTIQVVIFKDVLLNIMVFSYMKNFDL